MRQDGSPGCDTFEQPGTGRLRRLVHRVVRTCEDAHSGSREPPQTDRRPSGDPLRDVTGYSAGDLCGSVAVACRTDSRFSRVVSYSAATAVAGSVGTVHGMSYASDLTDEQWALLEPVFNAPGKRGPKHAPDLRRVVDAMLYISHTGCQWRFLPESFGPWTRVWSQFRRWSRNGTWARALTVLHKAAREADGRTEATPSMVVIDTHLARGASNGGFTFHDRGGPYGRTKGAKRVVAVDVTGLPVGALVVPASTHENRTSEVMLEHLTRQGVTERLELVLVDRGVTAAGARKLGRRQGLEVRRVGWDDKQPVFRPIRHAWRVEVAHGRLGRARRLAKSFENTTTSATGWLQVACIATTLRHLSAVRGRRRRVPLAA
jgi:putative transposase